MCDYCEMNRQGSQGHRVQLPNTVFVLGRGQVWVVRYGYTVVSALLDGAANIKSTANVETTVVFLEQNFGVVQFVIY